MREDDARSDVGKLTAAKEATRSKDVATTQEETDADGKLTAAEEATRSRDVATTQEEADDAY